MNNPAHTLRLIQTAPTRMQNLHPRVHVPFAYWVVETVCSGEYEIRAAGSPWMRLGEGEGVLYRPGVEFQERVREGICRSCFAIFAFEDRLLAGPLAEGRPFVRLADPLMLARSALENLQEFGDSPADQIGKQGHLCQLINLLALAVLEEDVLVIREKDDVQSRFSDRVDSYMRKNLHNPLRIADIAAHMNISSSGLQHAYRRETGSSPMRSLRGMRIEKAKAMLMKDGTGLGAIAHETGFSDAFHLSRCFKAREGVPPKIFRENRRNMR